LNQIFDNFAKNFVELGIFLVSIDVILHY